VSEEEIKKIAKEEFMNNVMEQLDSTLIFTYIQKLENQLQQKENIIKEVREYIKDKYAVLLADDIFLDHDEEIDRKRLLHILEILDKGE
jgi:hypothetical protein